MRPYTTKASERIGVESISRDGKEARVVSYTTCENFIVRFNDGKEMRLKNWKQFMEGNFNYKKYFKTPRNSNERIGEKKIMNNGMVATVMEYRGSHNVDIEFEDGEKRTGVSWRDFCTGNVAHPTIFGGNVSQNELVLKFYLEPLGFVRVPQRSKLSNYMGLEGKELDLYNDKLGIAIEYDGEYAHAKNKDDDGKNKIVEKLGIELYRFREPGCPSVSGKTYILQDSRFMSKSLEICLKSFVRDVLIKDDKFIDFKKDELKIKEYVLNCKRTCIHLYEKRKMSNGMIAQIIKMSSSRNITVRFEDGAISYNKDYRSFVKGNISHPQNTSLAKKMQRLNSRKQMKNGMMAEVFEYNSCDDIRVRFDNGEITRTTWYRFNKGCVALPSSYIINHIGEKRIQNRGNEEAEIIEAIDANHITVKFVSGAIVKNRKYEDFVKGAIGKPGVLPMRHTLKNERLGMENIMKNGMNAKIVRYGSANDIDIIFSDGTLVTHKKYSNFCKGSVAYKYSRSTSPINR